MSGSGNLHLVPPLYDPSGASDYIKSGQALALAWSPRDNSFLAYSSLAPNNAPGPSKPRPGNEEPNLYVVGVDSAPAYARRSFLTDTLVIFAAFRALMDVAHTQTKAQQIELGIQQKQIKLADDYVGHLRSAWADNANSGQKQDVYNGEHYRVMHSCFSLFVVLCMPDPGMERSMVGEQLMEWLNMNFVDPSSEEGDKLSALDKPWEDENFWPYITRTTLRGLQTATEFFLESLMRHPSKHVQMSATRLIPLIKDQPRAHQASTEKEFKVARRKWSDRVKLARIEFDRVPEAERDDGFENWWNWMSSILGVLEGREEVLIRVCNEIGAEWKDIVAAWTIFKEPDATRMDLPEILQELDQAGILPDLTDLEDSIHYALISRQYVTALEAAVEHDSWLAAHLADIMHELGLLKESDPARASIKSRETLILEYAEYTRSDPGLWRLSKEYFFSCGPIGQERGDEVLMHVPLQLTSSKSSDGVDQGGNPSEGDVTGVIGELMAMCAQKGRESARRTICKIGARWFLERKRYDLAVSYYSSAEDWPGLGRTVDSILDHLTSEGVSAFIDQAAQVLPMIHNLEMYPDVKGIFLQRLTFAVRYAEFHQFCMDGQLADAAYNLVGMFREGTAPKAWWGVLLLDSLDLLQNSGSMLFSSADASEFLFRVQEIDVAVSQGAGEDYLAVLTKMHKIDSEQEAFARLRPVRLALARYMARCGIIGVGGRDPMGPGGRVNLVY